jgi:hypothetical protein
MFDNLIKRCTKIHESRILYNCSNKQFPNNVACCLLVPLSGTLARSICFLLPICSMLVASIVAMSTNYDFGAIRCHVIFIVIALFAIFCHHLLASFVSF